MGPPRFGKDYKWYISGIYIANWGMDYATYLPPFRGTSSTTIEGAIGVQFLNLRS